MKIFTVFIWSILSYGMFAEASVIKINRDDTYIVDESGDVEDFYPSLEIKYVVQERFTEEQSKFLDTNAESPIKTWYNLKQVRYIEIVKVGFNYYLKIYFSPEEWYYIESFDCEKLAIRYTHELMGY